MDEIYKSDAEMSIIAKPFDLPSNPEESNSQEYDYAYHFYFLNFNTMGIQLATEGEIKEFYKTLKLRRERINLWNAMRINGWVKGSVTYLC